MDLCTRVAEAGGSSGGHRHRHRHRPRCRRCHHHERHCCCSKFKAFLAIKGSRGCDGKEKKRKRSHDRPERSEEDEDEPKPKPKLDRKYDDLLAPRSRRDVPGGRSLEEERLARTYTPAEEDIQAEEAPQGGPAADAYAADPNADDGPTPVAAAIERSRHPEEEAAGQPPPRPEVSAGVAIPGARAAGGDERKHATAAQQAEYERALNELQQKREKERVAQVQTVAQLNVLHAEQQERARLAAEVAVVQQRLHAKQEQGAAAAAAAAAAAGDDDDDDVARQQKAQRDLDAFDRREREREAFEARELLPVTDAGLAYVEAGRQVQADPASQAAKARLEAERRRLAAALKAYEARKRQRERDAGAEPTEEEKKDDEEKKKEDEDEDEDADAAARAAVNRRVLASLVDATQVAANQHYGEYEQADAPSQAELQAANAAEILKSGSDAEARRVAAAAGLEADAEPPAGYNEFQRARFPDYVARQAQRARAAKPGASQRIEAMAAARKRPAGLARAPKEEPIGFYGDDAAAGRGRYTTAQKVYALEDEDDERRAYELEKARLAFEQKMDADLEAQLQREEAITAAEEARVRAEPEAVVRRYEQHQAERDARLADRKEAVSAAEGIAQRHAADQAEREEVAARDAFARAKAAQQAQRDAQQALAQQAAAAPAPEQPYGFYGQGRYIVRKKPQGPTRWNRYVAKFRLRYPTLSFGQAVQKAKVAYRKKYHLIPHKR